jgi:hypothetical protein
MQLVKRNPERTAERSESAVARGRKNEAARRKAEAERAREQAERRRADAQFRETPQGRARTAKEIGHQLFQISFPLDQTERTFMGVLTGSKDDISAKSMQHANLLCSIEAEGWRLEHAGYVSRETRTVSKDKFLSNGQASAVTGEVMGIYVFRALDHRSAAISVGDGTSTPPRPD